MVTDFFAGGVDQSGKSISYGYIGASVKNIDCVMQEIRIGTSSASAIQIYSPRDIEIPFSHCLKGCRNTRYCR